MNESANLDRAKALEARPVRLPIEGEKELPGGKVQITVRLTRPRWQRWLGSDHQIVKTFELDPYGREVYSLCDGKNRTREIIVKFAEKYKISVAEAELSVTTFFKTLISKGLIAMGAESL